MYGMLSVTISVSSGIFVDRVIDTEKDTKAQNTVKNKEISDWVKPQQQASVDQSESGYGTTSSDTFFTVSEEGDDDLASGSQDDHLESQAVAEVHKGMFP